MISGGWPTLCATTNLAAPFAIFEGWDSASRNCGLFTLREWAHRPLLQLSENFLGQCFFLVLLLIQREAEDVDGEDHVSLLHG